MFTKYEFTKSWLDPSDFPTIEADETKVREDLQCLHEETKQAIWALIDALASAEGAAGIGAAGKDGTTDLQNIVTALLETAHSHSDTEALEQVCGAFRGMSPTDTLTDDSTLIPTAKAVLEQMKTSGMADMLQAVYDPSGRQTDIFAYADEAAEACAPMEHDHPDKAPLTHTHAFAELSGGPLPLEQGGTGAATADAARTALSAAAASHDHAAGSITSGTLGVARGGTGKASHTANAVLTGNGTGAINNVATASGALYATTANGAPKFGILPIAQGGTGSSSGATGLKNLFAAGSTVLSSYQYGTTLPAAGTKGRIFFKKVSS